MATLSAVSNGVRSATATQAGTYTFNTKNKYNNANIAFTVPEGMIAFDSSNTLKDSNGHWTYESLPNTGLKVTIKGALSFEDSETPLDCGPGWITKKPTIYGSMLYDWSTTFTDANFTAANIKKGTTIFGITGTLDYVKTVTSVPTTKDTSIIYNSTDSKYYLWRA